MSSLNTYASYLVSVFSEQKNSHASQEGIRVNPIVSEIASWYEKVRNAMDYRDDEVVLRAAIERILKRRHFYGGKGETIAAPLLRELTWARYFPDGSITDTSVKEVEEIINKYLALKEAVKQLHTSNDKKLTTFIYHLISSELTYFLNPDKKRDTMAHFVYHVMKNGIVLEDDPESTRDIQVFIATRKAFAKDDLALIHFHLFTQYFGPITMSSIPEVAKNFSTAYAEIETQLSYPLRHKIISFVKRSMPSFFVLEEVLLRNPKNLESVLNNPQALEQEIQTVCSEKYTAIRSKVNRAVVRSLIFLIMTKTVVALSIEGTFESIVYGEIMWTNIILNIIIPPILLSIAATIIKTPGEENTTAIIKRIQTLLFNDNPLPVRPIKLQRVSKTKKSLLYPIFSILWIGAFFASFGLVISLLNLIQFNVISQSIFIFFLAVVAFLIYRIYQTAHTYTVSRKQTLFTPIIDFLFLPIARVGRYITEGVSQVNIFLVIIDLLIEAPFKGLFSFFEQWFMFLHAKREYLD